MKKVLGGLVSLCVVAVACAPKAETPASPKLVQTCDSICAKRASCEKGFSAEACNKRCTTYESVRDVEGFRGDVGDRILDCLAKDACAEDLGAATNKCAAEVGKTLPRTDKVKSLCGKLESQFRDCNLTWKIPCPDLLSLYDPADLGAFDECVDRQCRGGSACFRETGHTLQRKHAK